MQRRQFAKLLPLLGLTAAVGLVGGCATKPPTLLDYAQQAVDRLIPQLSLDPQRPVLVSSFVNIDNLKQSSTFGRTLAELMSAAMARAKVAVVDVRALNAMSFTSEGELILSREIVQKGNFYNAQAVLVGTYAIFQKRVLATYKVISLSDNRVLGATETEFPYEI